MLVESAKKHKNMTIIMITAKIACKSKAEAVSSPKAPPVEALLGIVLLDIN